MAFAAPKQIASREDAIKVARAAGRYDAKNAAAAVYADATDLDARTLKYLGRDWRDDLRLTAEYVAAFAQAFDAELARLSPAAAHIRKQAELSMIEDARPELDRELKALQADLI